LRRDFRYWPVSAERHRYIRILSFTGAKAVVISEKSKTAELTTGPERIADDLVAALREAARDPKAPLE
jgi:hypothetical protein